MSETSTLTVIAKNFRTLTHLDWSPSGVCALVGPNGSGKTTTLSVLTFLRGLFTLGHADAFGLIHGSSHLKSRGVPREIPVHIELHLGDIHWEIDLPVHGAGLTSYYGEVLRHGDRVVARAEMYKERWNYLDQQRLLEERRCCAKWVWDHDEPAWMRPLVDLLENLRVYDAWWMDAIRRGPSPADRREWLHRTGQNLWTVLETWKSSPRRYEDRFAWVTRHMREAFPDVFGDLELGAQPMVFPPGLTSADDGIPTALQADGVLTALLLLTAVAGARRGAIVAFDEVENQLHPYAIRCLLHAMRERAAAESLTILLTTHSPVVLNAFEDMEDQVYVMEPGHARQPQRLTDIHDAVWLTAFSLGKRYERNDLAPQGLH